MNPATSRDTGKASSCSVSMAFNFTAGAIAVVAAVTIGYVVYAYVISG
jgi:hypothetical protein